MNTSMTINGTAMWLLALYVALARERGEDESKLQGTTQNDLIKEYLARGTYIFPPEASMRLIAEMYEYCLEAIPKWNASNICSYHLQEAGAAPVQELAFALANAISLLDLLKERGHFDDEQFERAVGRISFFVNAGIRFIEEMCKMRAFGQLWDSYTAERFGVKNEKYRRFRYGVQVNSLGLTEAQPENNAWRIILESLGVTLSRNARCRALQLPAWNEAMSLPRPWDQQWSLRLQQILAYETDLLEYPDLFDGSPVVEGKVAALIEEATAEIETILGMGGVIPAIESGYMKTALVRSMSERMSKINSGEQIVVGLNKWTDGLPSPLTAGDDGGIFKVDEKAAEQIIAGLDQVRAARDSARAEAAIDALKASARDGSSLMEPSIECALARVTTGEWAGALREVFGEYRPATGIEGQQLGLTGDRVEVLRGRINALAEGMGHRPRIVVGKPGLDGHSNGAEVIAVSARHVGFDVIYSGIRLSPDEIVQSAVEEGADLIGASVLSGSHIDLAKQILEGLREQGADEDIAVVFGGIIPPADATELESMGIRKVFTPADYDLMDIMESMVDVLEAR
jgi:(2R)-ethylmalonyl-CoA mutase